MSFYGAILKKNVTTLHFFAQQYKIARLKTSKSLFQEAAPNNT